MASPGKALHKALLAKIDTLVTCDVWDAVPQGTDYPYVLMDSDVSTNEDYLNLRVNRRFVYLSIWSRAEGSAEVRGIIDQIDATERLLVRIDASTELLRRELKKADDAVASSSSKMEKAVQRINKSFSLLGVAIGAAGIGLAFKKVFDATAEQERVTAQLNATLVSTGGAAGKTADELLNTAASLQKVTRYSDEAIIGAQNLLLTFKEIKGDNFDRATDAILDMSTAMGQDLKSSTIQLGKALNDPIKGLGALSRVGVQFTEAQKDLITTMAETGRVAEAQVLILKEMESQFGGSAEAARNTLAGALEGLSNAFGDLFEAQGSALGPMKQSLNELEAILSDPAFVQGAQDIAAAILSIGVAAAEALPAVIDFTKWVGEELAASVGGAATDDIPRLEKQLADAREELERFGQMASAPGFDDLREKIAKLEAQLKTAYEFQENLTVSTKKGAVASTAAAKAVTAQGAATGAVVTTSKEYAKVAKDLVKELDKLRDRHTKANDQLTAGIKELDELVASNDRYIEQLEFEVSLLGKTAREQALLTVEHEHAGKATEEQMEKIRALNAQLYDAEAATEAAAAAQKPFQDALQGTIERIDTAFASAWQGAFDSFSEFSDGIKDSFKNLIGELIHLAITRPIVMQIGAAVGLGGASGAASAAGGMASGAGGLSGIGTSLLGLGSGVYSGMGDIFTRLGMDQLAVQSYGAGMTATLGSMAMNAGAGLLGGFAGNAVFGGGGYSNIGATIGGIGGSIFGPVGAGVGSFIGSGIGSLFGGSNNGDNKGRADINLGTGVSNVYGVGKSFNQANVDALSQIVPVLQEFADAIGGSQAVLNLTAGNNSGLRLNGTKYGNPDELIAAAIKEIVSGATTLSATLKKLVANFDGSTDEVAAFSGAMLSISQQLQQNPVTKAVDDFAASSKLAGMTATQLYNDQRKALDELVYGFDGSAEAAVALNNALVQNRTAAYEMALAIEQIGQSINQAASDSIAYFQESTRTPDEQLQYMQKQLEFGAALLPGIKDPAQLAQWGQALLDINKRVFDMGPDDLQRSNVGTFIDFADFVRDTVTERLGSLSSTLEADQANLSKQLGAMLEVAAAGFQAPADTMLSASQLMYLAVQNFINGGGQYSQVVA